jgi:hypothetical protein
MTLISAGPACGEQVNGGGFRPDDDLEGQAPGGRLVEAAYATGVRLKPKEMKALESEVVRLAGLGRWFVEIPARVPDG